MSPPVGTFFVSPPTKKLPWLASISGLLCSSPRLLWAGDGMTIASTRMRANIQLKTFIVVAFLSSAQLQPPESSEQQFESELNDAGGFSRLNHGLCAWWGDSRAARLAEDRT